MTPPDNPMDDNYDFGGWYKEEGCQTVWDFNNDTVTGSVELFAKWTPNNVVVTDIDAPVAGSALDTTAATSTEHVTLGAVSWNPSDATAAYATEYTASVMATVAANYAFPDTVTATVNGETATVTKNADGTLTISYKFAKTALNPVTITGTDKEVTYDGNPVDIPVSGMFTIPDGVGAATYAVTNGTGAGTYTDGKLTVTKAGTFTVKATTAETSTHAEGSASATLTVNKANPSVTAPAAVANLVYTGAAQELITAGTTSDGTMNYKLGSDGTYSANIPTGTAAGDYTVYYKVVGDVNHLDSDEGSVPVTIAKAPLSVTADDKSKTYGETDPALTYQVSGLAGSDGTTGVLSGEVSRESGEDVKDGGYKIGQGGLALSSDGAANYDLTFSDGTFTINPKSITGAAVALSADSYAYDGTEKTAGITSVTLSDNTVLAPSDYTVSGNTGTAVGSYTVTVTGTGNYTDTASASWSIANGTLSGIAAENVSVEYDGTAHGITVTGVPSGAAVTYSTASDGTFSATAPTITNAADSPLTVYYKVSADSYEDFTGSATVTVNPKSITGAAVALSADSYAYDGTEKTAGITSVTLSDNTVLTASDYTVSGNTGTAVGSYTVTVTGTGNYTDTAAASWSITSGTLSGITAENVSVEYDATAHGITVTGVPSGAVVTYSTASDGTYSGTAPTITNAADSPLTVYYKVSADSYEDFTGSATVTVNPKEITLNWSNTSLTYNGAEQVPTVEAGGLVSGDTCTVTVTGGQTNAGSYTATASALDNGNYKMPAAVTTTFTIAKKAATVTAKDQTVDLNSSIQTAISNAVLSDAVSGHTLSAVTLTGSSTANATTSGTIIPSAAVIKSGETDVTANYEITYANGVLTVNQGASGVTAPTAKTLTYSGTAQALVTAGTATGGTMQYAIGTDGTTTPTTGYGTAIPTGTDAGTYYVWYKVVGDADHTDTTPACVTATIEKKAATVTANAQTVDLNGEIDSTVSNAALSGAVDGHTLSAVTLTGSSTANATTSGTITPSAAVIKSGDTDVTANYEITYANGVLTVNQGASGVTAPTANTLTYSGTAQELVTTGTATGGTMQYALGTDETTAPTTGYDTAIPTGTDAGTYYVWYKAAGDADHTDTTPACVTATIGKKSATVTANAQTVDLNGAIDSAVSNAALSGAVSGHTLSAVTLTGSSTANATTSGTITPSAAVIKSGDTDVTANYEITYANGVLTVNQGASGVTAPTANSLTYSGAAQELVTTGTATGGTMQYALGTDGTTAPTTGYDTAIPTGTDAGAYYVWYKVAGDADHTDTTPACVTATIEKKAATVTANAQTVDLNGAIDSAVSNAALSGAVSGHTLSAVTLTGSSTANATTSGTITPSAATIKSGDTDVTANYEITYANGVLTVNQGASGVTAPTANTLTYSGVEQELVTTGTATGGTMQYALGTDGTTAPTTGFGTAVPTGTNAGTYYVWYKVAGDTDHTDTIPACVTATIEKKAATVTANAQTVDLNGEIDSTVSNAALSGAVDGHTLSTVTLTASSTAAATTSGTITPSGAKIVNGSTDVTDNYEITYTAGKLTVTPAPVYTVTVTSDSNGSGSANPASGESGTVVTLTPTPNSGYQFKEWQVVSGGVTVADNKFTIGTEDVTVKAVFEAIPAATLTVVWLDADGKEIERKTYSDGEDEPTTDQRPTKAADEENNYTFKGWKLKSNTDGVKTYEPEFDATPIETEPEQATLTVIWLDADGKEIERKMYSQDADEPTTDQRPTKAADSENTFTFKGWKLKSNTDGVKTYEPEFNATPIEAEPEPETLTVIWLDADGKEIERKTYSEDEDEPTTDHRPTKAADSENTYTFKQWKLKSDADGVKTYEPEFDATPIETEPEPATLTVIWLDADGKEIERKTYSEGEDEPTTDHRPTKPADSENTYTFKGWKLKSDTDGVKTYEPEFTATPIETEPEPATLTVIWLDADGKEIERKTYSEGEDEPTTDQRPTKAADEENTYTFKGWKLKSNTDGVKTYEPEFTATSIETEPEPATLTVIWLDADGKEIERKTYKENETEPITDQRPTKPADSENTYTFKQWKLKSDADGVKTYEPEFAATPIETEPESATLTVVWLDADGKEIERKTYSEGEDEPTTDKKPTKAADDENTYTFKGWKLKSDADGVKTYEPEFTATPIEPEPEPATLTVIWLDADGKEIERKTYSEGEDEPTTDQRPTKPADSENTYTFKGWKLKSDTDGVKTYEPEFTATPIETEPEPTPTVSVTTEGWSGAYDGETHSITVNAPRRAIVTYSENRSGPYQTENPAYKDSGNYTVYYRVAADGFEETTGSETVTISKADLRPTLTLVDRSNTNRTRNSWPYGGPAGVPKLTMERAETNASLLGMVARLFADQTVTDYGLTVYSYKAQSDTDYQPYTAEELETLSAGRYTLRVEAAESRNYNAVSAEADFTVTKAGHSDVTVEPVKVLTNTENLSVDLSSYLEEGSVCAVSDFSGGLLSGPPSVADDVLRFDTGSGQSGTIRVTVSGPNYEDYTITVNLTAASAFTLRFESNGGNAVTSEKTLRIGEAYGTLPVPTRTGYTFDGWFQNDGERATAATVMGGADTILYAHWTPVAYTVTLNLNGGSLTDGVWTGTGDTRTRTFQIDTPDFTLPEASRAGHTFTGWAESGGKAALEITVYQGTVQNLTFDAIWQEGELEGEVEFVREDEGSGVLGILDLDQDGTDTQRSTTEDDAYRTTSLSNAMKEIASDIAEEIAENDKTKDVTVTLKAFTTPDLTGKPDSDLSAKERDKKQEQSRIKTLAEGLFQSAEERQGMRADFLDLSIERTVRESGASQSVTESVTSASRVVEIPLRYNLTGRYHPVIFRYHGIAEALRRLSARPRTYQELEGCFYVSGRGNDAVIYLYTSRFSTYTVVTTDTELYNVFFETDGGTAVETQTVRVGDYAVKPADPEKTGFTFAGWYIQENGAEREFDFEKDAVSEDLTLTAHWTANVPTAPTTPNVTYSGGSGRNVTTYPVTAADTSNGTVMLSAQRAAGGTKVTVTAKPDEGYDLQSVSVQTADGQSVAVTKNADGTYTFTQPASAVTVTPVFAAVSTGTEPAPTPAVSTDNPVSPAETGVADWLVVDSHPAYISGFADGTFRPNANITRAQTAVMFYRLLKNQNVQRTTTFADMDGSEWYADAVYTLSSLGIIQGYSDGSFHGNDSISRAAFTAIAARFAKNGSTVKTLTTFSDVPSSHWAYDTIARASGYGWIGGYSDGTFRPAAPITRAAVTAIINRMLGRSADEAYVTAHTDNLNRFTDVQDPAAWYYYNVAEAANSHTYTVTGGEERWNGISG